MTSIFKLLEHFYRHHRLLHLYDLMDYLNFLSVHFQIQTKQGDTKLNCNAFPPWGVGVSVKQSEAALKVSHVNTKELSSHAQLYYRRRERAVM